MNYINALRLVHEIIKPTNYCEIGCRFGHSLALSRVPTIGIDPEFEIRVQLNAAIQLYRMTSDEFFAKECARKIFDGAVDFAFIDGMHLAEYALRDFINLEKASHPLGLIAIDDLLPGDLAYAIRERNTQIWTGDVYRMIPILTHYRPELEIRVYDVDVKGFAVISRLDPSSTVLSDRLAEIETDLAAGRWTLSSVDAVRQALSPRPVGTLEPDLRQLAQQRA